MIIEIDDKSGFCYGVIRAIETAEKELKENGKLFSLGEIVHNNVEVGRLNKIGLQTINHEQINNKQGEKILIRAHGEPPATYKLAKENNIEIVDCTCPVVLKLQERIRKTYAKAKEVNGQLVIFGKSGHAEVNGLIGQVDGDAIVIEQIDEVDKIDFSRPVFLFSQTTKSTEGFDLLCRTIENRMTEGGHKVQLESNDTICRQVTGRKPHLAAFSKRLDVVIFVSGKQSSNGKVLYETCKSINERTHFVESPSDLQKEWFENCNSVGVCGATSTPKWLMEEVAKEIAVITMD